MDPQQQEHAESLDVPPGADQAVSLKILASHVAAGAVIGKSGASIAEIQNVSKAAIQISRVNEVFPGTTERIMQISGQMFYVVSALHLILQKWVSENVFGDNEELAEGQVQLRLVTLGRLCGAVIGEGGKTIKDIKYVSECDIRVQSRDMAMPGVNERIITIIGEPANILTAVSHIVNKFLEEPAFEAYRNQPLALSMAGGLPGLSSLRLSHDDPLADVACCWTLMLTNEQAGAVLGVKGRNIEDVLRQSHAQVRIQNRADVDGGALRELRIEGNLEQCSIAMGMVVSKLRDSSHAPRARGGNNRREGQGERGDRPVERVEQ